MAPTSDMPPNSDMPPPTLADAGWLKRSETQAVFSALHGAGHQARCVGGAVRNALMGVDVTDIDIATTAAPEEVMAVGKRAGLKVYPTGLQHGTVTVVSRACAFEVTTLREDVETFGRHANVAFTSDWQADAMRRDFTMNALYCDSDGTLVDPLAGYRDIAGRHVRFIGDARARIREDFLRILRFFRFNAEYGADRPDETGLAACVAERDGLVLLSPERIRKELLRLFAAPRAVQVCETMYGTGFLAGLIGAAPRLTQLRRLTEVEAALGLAPDPQLRLAVLGVAVAEDACRISQRLRLSNADADVLALAGAHNIDLDPKMSEDGATALLYRFGTTPFRRCVLIAWTRSGDKAENQQWRRLYELPQRRPLPLMPFSGADLLAMGLAPGPQVGKILRRFERWWILSGFPAADDANRAKLAELAELAELAAKAQNDC